MSVWPPRLECDAQHHDLSTSSILPSTTSLAGRHRYFLRKLHYGSTILLPQLHNLYLVPDRYVFQHPDGFIRYFLLFIVIQPSIQESITEQRQSKHHLVSALQTCNHPSTRPPPLFSVCYFHSRPLCFLLLLYIYLPPSWIELPGFWISTQRNWACLAFSSFAWA